MTDWTECDWSRQLASVIGDQTRIMNDLRAVKESAKKTEKAHSDNYQNLYDGIKELQSQIQMLAITNTPRSAAYEEDGPQGDGCLLYTSPSPRDRTRSRMPSSA